MTDQFTLLNANMSMLIAAVTDLTAAVHENTRVSQAATVATANKPAAQQLDPAAALSELSLAPSPPSTPGPHSVSNSIGNRPEIIRDKLATMAGPGTQGGWYVVTVGYEPGVYQDIAQVMHLTNGISGNTYKKHPSQAGAMDAYERAWSLGAVRRVR
ncbi:hypothetical protein BJ912DRAFT_1065930 [Pholiota molesta]|nr:hypothetical protein BJ912DRAFT_1065930 [Pholiota molesta]